MSYSRLVPWESRAADQITALLINCSPEQRVNGVTLGQLQREYPTLLKDGRSLIQAVDLLADEGQLVQVRSTGRENVLDSIRVYPQLCREIPPSEEHFDRVEEHGDESVRVHIRFYRDIKKEYFVWPFVRRKESFRHFQVLRSFSDLQSAREATLNIGRTLIEVGFDPSLNA